MSRSRANSTWWGRPLSHAVLLLASAAALFPIYWTVATSLKNRADTFANPPQFVSFDPTGKNYEQLFSNDVFGRIYLNTIVVTLVSTAISVLIGSLAAYALARHRRFPGRRPFEATLVLVRAMPGIVLMVPMYQIFTRLDLYDNRAAMSMIFAAVNLPFAVWLMTGFFDQIPVEVEESARIDGATGPRVFFHVVLPLAAPGVVATSIFVALLSWNEFLIPVLLAGENAKTLPVYISSFIANKKLDWGPMAAASALAIIPIAIFTAIIQRRLVGGLSSGAVKG